MFWLAPHIKVNIRNAMFEKCMTTLRPYSSLRGAKTSGPKVKGTMYAETTNPASAALSELNSASNFGTPGAKMVEARDLWQSLR